MLSPRTSWQVTKAVWYALFMREALSRTTGDRFAWFWMLVEPIAMIVVMLSLRGMIAGGRHIAGAEFIPWMLVGLMGFYLFRENLQCSLGAMQGYKGLFAYRQVKSTDPVFVRCFLEGMLKTFILVLFIFAGVLLDIDLIADDPLFALFCWFSLWCLGVGAALTFSAVSELVPEAGKIVRITSMPLLILSGVIFPLNYLPFWVQEYLLWNPIVHGLELLRMAFFENYRHVAGVDMGYLWLWNFCLIAFGLMLHMRFEPRLKAQ
ncbi:ABC transporter permease [Amphritea sp.]|uniref:ABC transporter permease n=1 Tax=Amphritea sp. TaxID=1872502 RepID=UPI003D10F641